jgi:hypothetical protein
MLCTRQYSCHCVLTLALAAPLSAARQHRSERHAGVTAAHHHLLGSTGGDDAAAAVAALGPQVDDSVAFGHHIQDHDHQVAERAYAKALTPAIVI